MQRAMTPCLVLTSDPLTPDPPGCQFLSYFCPSLALPPLLQLLFPAHQQQLGHPQYEPDPAPGFFLLSVFVLQLLLFVSSGHQRQS